MMVSSIYNIVDQFFIGQSVGALGNAATNIYYPLTIACISLALLCGIGGASAFNLAMGKGEKDIAKYYIGNSVSFLLGAGVVLMLVTLLFTTPILRFFGSPDDVLPYALTYTRICAIGFPFLIMTAGGSHLIRADGAPKMSMYCNLLGAGINTTLDALFVFGLGWGIAGAAWATIIGQIASFLLVVNYMRNYKSVRLDPDAFRIRWKYIGRLMGLGMSSFLNQVAMMVMAVLLNKSLKYYGSLSIYGEAIPIACSGITTKCMMLVMSVIIGLSQGMQPIASFNYGAQQYDRVKHAFYLALKCGSVVSIAAFLLFQFFPRQIIAIFGDGDALYYTFGVRYIRIYFFCIFTHFMQPIAANFFSAIGKPQKGVFLSLTRQVIFYLPMLLILPRIFGIDGIMYTGASTDCIAFLVCTVVSAIEMRREEYRS